ncbi:MAG: beta-galactosidase, partial [Ardenticatenaceae bacterium]
MSSPLLTYGVDYYPEQWPEERWSEDAQQMREVGLCVVRLAEFAWALFEPEEGHFEWGWFDQVLDAL